MLDALSRRGFLTGTAASLAAVGAAWGTVLQAQEDRLVVRTAEDLSNLDPAYRTGPTDVNVILAVHQGLVRFKPGSTEWEPDAAAEIAQVSDTEIAFTLKDGLTFSGGYGPVTAEDVKFSFERFLAPTADGGRVPYADDWGTLDRVEVTGPLSGRILFTAPSPAVWVIALADGSGAIVSRAAYEALGDEARTTPIGSGPYLLSEWTPRERFVLTANPDYQGPAPAFATIEARPIADDKTAQLALEAGEIDFGQIDPAVASEIEATEGLEVQRLSAIDYVWIGPNIARAPFDDVRVRRALRLAIDVPSIIAAAYDGTVDQARALLAPGLLGHWAEAPAYVRDLDAARALLEEAGLGDGFETRLTVLNSAVAQTTAAIVQANLAEIGVTVEIEALDGGAYWAHGENDASAALDLVLVEYSGKFDPSFQTQWFTTDQIGTWNWQRWSSPEFDALHAEGAATTDPARREEIYLEAQRLMDESAAFWWITHNAYTFAYDETVVPGILPNGSQWQYAAFRRA